MTFFRQILPSSDDFAPPLATWVLWRLVGKQAAQEALGYVVPVGEEEQYIAKTLSIIEPFITSD